MHMNLSTTTMMMMITISAMLLVTLLAGSGMVQGGVIGAAVIPHGDFALDPTLIDNVNGSAEIHKACLYVGELINQLQPDLIFLSTPHGMAINHDFGIYLNTNARYVCIIYQCVVSCHYE
jgi:aromatic ring-opening dioxygenase LigB subunit